MYNHDYTKVEHSYFNEKEIVETFTGTYADRSSEIVSQTVSWNHPNSEVLNSLIRNGLSLESFDEYNWSPYACFQDNEEISPGKFRIPQFQGKIPMVFSLEATKKSS